jgi:hypothetical protein
MRAAAAVQPAAAILPRPVDAARCDAAAEGVVGVGLVALLLLPLLL